MGNLLQNPFSSAGGASNNGPAGGQSTSQTYSPNTGANAGNSNSGTNPNGNTGNNQVNANPNDNQGNPNNQQNNKSTETQGNDSSVDFNALWQPKLDKDGNPVTQQKKSYLNPLPDADAMKETLSKVSFTRDVTPEQKQAIAGGGEGAVAALFDIMDNLGRRALELSYQTSHRMANSALDNFEQGIQGQIPEFVRSSLTHNSIKANNPLMNDPLYAPVVDGLRTKMLSQFPKATPEAIESALDKYFIDMANKLTAKNNPKKQQTNDDLLRSGSGEADWEDWISKEMGLGKSSPDDMLNI